MSQNIPLPLTIVELKTLAVAKALEFAIDLGFSMWMEDVSSHTFIVYQADLPIT